MDSFWCPKTITIVTSQINITNIAIIKKPDTANAIEKMALTELAPCGIVTSLQFVKKHGISEAQ